MQSYIQIPLLHSQGGHLVALEEVTEALASEEFEARVESVARFVRDVDRPLDRRSNTLEPEDLAWDN